MKKNLIKTSTLSLAMFILWLCIIRVNAATPVPVTLQVTIGGVACSNSTAGGAVWSAQASFLVQSLTWYFTPNSWTCTDTKWAAWTNNYMVQATIITGSAWVNIAASNVFMMQTGYSTTAGNITWTSALNAWAAIDTSKALYTKSATLLTGLGTFVITPNIYVTLPANTPVGAYTGIITVTDAQ